MTGVSTVGTRRSARAALLFVVAAVIGGLACPASAELRIDITRGTIEPLPIAVTHFYGATPQDAQAGLAVARVIEANLERSGLFRLLGEGSFVQEPEALLEVPRFADWRTVRADALVTGTVSREADGRLTVGFRLWDTVAEQQMAGLALRSTPDNWRRVAHRISDAIYKRITGEDGYFDTRVVYVAESGPANERVKRLAIMDQDGANHRYLTDGRTLVLTPRFSPNPATQDITYLAYLNRKPRVYIFNIDTGRQELLGGLEGISYAPRFSPGGNRVVFSRDVGGQSNIYILDLRTRAVRQLTDTVAIDTSPSFSPDGSRIVFESDRGGSQQLYIMNADGSGARRISFGGGTFGGPVWSPRGDLIAYTRIFQRRFGIGVIRPDGTGERILTEAFHVEGPTWAPNGRVLMYFRETPSADGRQRVAKLYQIDLTGRNDRLVPTPLDASDPAWSPLGP